MCVCPALLLGHLRWSTWSESWVSDWLESGAQVHLTELRRTPLGSGIPCSAKHTHTHTPTRARPLRLETEREKQEQTMAMYKSIPDNIYTLEHKATHCSLSLAVSPGSTDEHTHIQHKLDVLQNYSTLVQLTDLFQKAKCCICQYSILSKNDALSNFITYINCRHSLASASRLKKLSRFTKLMYELHNIVTATIRTNKYASRRNYKWITKCFHVKAWEGNYCWKER